MDQYDRVFVVLFQILGDSPLDFCDLVRCTAVCKPWKEAVRQCLLLLRVLNFHGYEARVAGTNVLCALKQMAGGNLQTLDLSGCSGLNGADVEEILCLVHKSCLSIETIDVTGCQDQAQLCAAVQTLRAVGARFHFDCASPCALFKHLKGGAVRYPWAGLRAKLEPRLKLDTYVYPRPAAIRKCLACGEQSAWDVALLLSTSFLMLSTHDGNGFMQVDGQRVVRINFDGDKCEEDDASRRRLVHFAAERGDKEMMAVLVSAGADLNAKNLPGNNTPLLVSIAAGHIELARMLVTAGADVSAANSQGTSPLLACIAGMHGSTPRPCWYALRACIAVHVNTRKSKEYMALAHMLVDKGANRTTARRDGADLLSLAIVSRNEEVIKFAFRCGPRRFEGQGSANSADAVAQLAQCFLNPRNIGAWLHGGASPSALIGEIGALLSSAAVDQPVQDQLDNVRAFINHHTPLLCGPSEWPVAHRVEQLASQEPVSTFLRAHLTKTPVVHSVIEWVNKPQGLRACRQTMMAPHGQVRAIAFSPDGSRLASAQGTMVVVCDARTGLVESILAEHLGR